MMCRSSCASWCDRKSCRRASHGEPCLHVGRAVDRFPRGGQENSIRRLIQSRINRRGRPSLNDDQQVGWDSNFCGFRNSAKKANRINAISKLWRSLRESNPSFQIEILKGALTLTLQVSVKACPRNHFCHNSLTISISRCVPTENLGRLGINVAVLFFSAFSRFELRDALRIHELAKKNGQSRASTFGAVHRPRRNVRRWVPAPYYRGHVLLRSPCLVKPATSPFWGRVVTLRQ